MKIIKIYCLTILLIFNFIIPKHSYAQDNDGLWGALAAGAIAGAIAIEDNKEYLESLASNIIFSNYPEYNEFRIKTLGWGDGAKRLSDKGKVNLYPFALTKLKNTLPTENRKLLLLFASPGWINEYGLDYTKLRWELWSLEDWNKCMSYFTELNSPINIPIESNLIPIFKKNGNKTIKGSDMMQKESNSGNIFIASPNDKNMFYEYIQDENKSTTNISNLKLTKEGWKLKNKIIYPFFNMKGDDYIVKDYSETLKIFSNEDALGFFLKEEQDQMLVRYTVLNKIHVFINNTEEE